VSTSSASMPTARSLSTGMCCSLCRPLLTTQTRCSDKQSAPHSRPDHNASLGRSRNPV
jgi:hypothetical protein